MKTLISLLSVFLGITLFAEESVFKFDEFNAKHKNSFAAISDILNLARSKNGSPVRIEFSKKTYNVEKDLNYSWFFNLSNLKNITIDGKGAKLMIDPSNAYCIIRNCENVVLKNFEFEHNRLAFTQGDIVEVNDEYFVMKLDDGYPEFPSHEFVMNNYPASQWMWGCYMDRKARTLLANYPDHIFFQKIIPAEKPRHYKFYPKPAFIRQLKRIKTGEAFVMPIHQDPHKAWKNSHGPYTIIVVGSKNISVENITARATRHAGWAVAQNEGKVIFKNCTITWRANSNDLISSWRDGAHCKNNRIGPTFINCKWEGLLDDSINIGANPSMIKEDLGNATYKIYGGYNLKKGGKVGIFIPSTGTWIEGEQWYIQDYKKGIVKLSKPIPDLVCRQDISQYEITSGHAKKNILATQLYALDYVSEKYEIINCKFGKQRRYAMIIRSPNGTITNNKIYGGAGIMISNEIGSWYEGPFPINTKICGNSFENVKAQYPLTIALQSANNDKAKIPYKTLISDNKFLLNAQKNKGAIKTSFVSDVEIKNNKIFDKNKKPLPEGSAIFIHPSCNKVDVVK